MYTALSDVDPDMVNYFVLGLPCESKFPPSLNAA